MTKLSDILVLTALYRCCFRKPFNFFFIWTSQMGLLGYTIISQVTFWYFFNIFLNPIDYFVCTLAWIILLWYIYNHLFNNSYVISRWILWIITEKFTKSLKKQKHHQYSTKLSQPINMHVQVPLSSHVLQIWEREKKL